MGVLQVLGAQVKVCVVGVGGGGEGWGWGGARVGRGSRGQSEATHIHALPTCIHRPAQ